MARAITVKVATPKVIKALEAKLAQIEIDYAGQEVNEAKFQADYTAWQDSLKAYALANIANATNFRTGYRSWNDCLNIDFDVSTKGSNFPAEPTREFNQMAVWEYKNAKEEITNALNILRMTDEETVNASTMKSIAQYL
jgi:hypothetical protein